MKYIIIDANEVGLIDFNKVLEESIDSLEFNRTGTKTYIKYNEIHPSEFSHYTELSREEFKHEHSGLEWRAICIDGEYYDSLEEFENKELNN